MTNKSVTYMLVAVLIGVMLVSAVPDQIAMYVTPQQTLSIESGDSRSPLPKSGEEDVELYLDTTSAPEENLTEDNDIWFDIVNGTGHSSLWNGTSETQELGSSESGDEVYDLNEQVADLADELTNVTLGFEDVKSDIADVTAVAEDAVAAAEAATSVAATTAGSASQAAADAAEAANASREAASGLTTITMFIWYAVDALIAFGVYLLAKRRFS